MVRTSPWSPRRRPAFINVDAAPRRRRRDASRRHTRRGTPYGREEEGHSPPPQIALAPAFVDRVELRVRVQVVDALDVADQDIPFGGVERVGRKGLRRRPVLVVVDEAGVVVVLHEAPAKPIGPIDEALGAQCGGCDVVDELQNARRYDVNRLRRLELIKPVFFHTLWLERRRRESTSR